MLASCAGIVLVSTYYTTLGLAMEENSEYFRTPWDWAAIRKNAGFVIQVRMLAAGFGTWCCTCVDAVPSALVW